MVDHGGAVMCATKSGQRLAPQQVRDPTEEAEGETFCNFAQHQA